MYTFCLYAGVSDRWGNKWNTLEKFFLAVEWLAIRNFSRLIF
ncbi:hypothetical protein KKC1_02550 [Calderihabitans maritimus]|uniref:Uncharacterized protein n=1 Tax=Calderihabitans maritimus TaxID=1246530 RepID=A0A1Z5HNJ4_9FIRM|nr:hypothetical protein KKC1_02550 [Calderihabitans maritimus]